MSLNDHAKEKFFESLGLPISTVLADSEFTFPLVHAESDYKAVLEAGDKIAIEISVLKIGETSVSFAYTITKEDARLLKVPPIVPEYESDMLEEIYDENGKRYENLFETEMFNEDYPFIYENEIVEILYTLIKFNYRFFRGGLNKD